MKQLLYFLSSVPLRVRFHSEIIIFMPSQNLSPSFSNYENSQGILKELIYDYKSSLIEAVHLGDRQNNLVYNNELSLYRACQKKLIINQYLLNNLEAFLVKVLRVVLYYF